jgi:predicted nucleotidyltransferase
MLLPEQEATLRRLSGLWRETPFVLIGASALALQIDLEWRQTNDLDVVISVALDNYPAGLGDVAGWRRLREGEHAWRSPDGVKVDLVPADPGLLRAGSLTWPESGFRMSLAGFRLAFDHHILVPVGDDHVVAVATVPALVVLKMVAFLDRPAEREDDLGDIAQVVERYLNATDDRRWQLPVDFDNASAFALGTDVGSMLREDERQVVDEFIRKATDEGDRHRTHALLIRNGPFHWREHPEVLFDRLAAFEAGIRGTR